MIDRQFDAQAHVPVRYDPIWLVERVGVGGVSRGIEPRSFTMPYLTGFIKIATILTDRRGGTAIEYALVASLISVAAIMSFDTLGGKVEKKYDSVDVALDGKL